jgi:hypothetical protein
MELVSYELTQSLSCTDLQDCTLAYFRQRCVSIVYLQILDCNMTVQHR